MWCRNQNQTFFLDGFSNVLFAFFKNWLNLIASFLVYATCADEEKNLHKTHINQLIIYDDFWAFLLQVFNFLHCFAHNVQNFFIYFFVPNWHCKCKQTVPRVLQTFFSSKFYLLDVTVYDLHTWSSEKSIKMSNHSFHTHTLFFFVFLSLSLQTLKQQQRNFTWWIFFL